MAAKYRKVDPRVWDDEKFVRLTPDEKLVFIYCITGPQANRRGLYVLSLAMGAEKIGTLPQTFAERFRNVISVFGWGWDESVRVVYLPTWWKYNTPENPNVLLGCLSDLDDLPQTQLIQEFFSNTRYLPERLHQTFTQTLPQTFGKSGAGTGAGTGAGESVSRSREIERHEAAYRPTPEGFAEWFAGHPNKTKKQRAVEAWKSLDPDPKLRGRIMAGQKRWLASQQWADGKIELAANWLAEGLYDEEPEPAKRKLEERAPKSPEEMLKRMRKVAGVENV